MTKIQKFLKEYKYLKSCVEHEEHGELGYKWKFKTKHVGVFSVSIHHKPDEKRVRVYSVFGRFEEPKRAYEVYLCNQYSGKYNFHQCSPNNCLEQFQSFIEDSMGIEIDRNYLDKDAI